MSEPHLSLEGISKAFEQGGRRIEVLKGVSFKIRSGEMVALVGPSGSGKSTLLQITGLLEKPDSGKIFVAGEEASRLDDTARTRLRRKSLGFVYQYHHLLPEFSALENLVVPQMIAGVSKKTAISQGRELLARVKLSDRESHRPARLSGGEQQRVAIARALVNNPAVLLADEPTGNLDPDTAEGVFRMLVDLVSGVGLAALVATHNLELASRMDRVLRLEEGHVVSS